MIILPVSADSVSCTFPMKSLGIRVVSALAALAFLFGFYLALGPLGLKIVSFFLIIIGIFELQKILFTSNEMAFLIRLFCLVVYLLFQENARRIDMAGINFAIFSLFFFIVCIFLHKHFETLERLIIFQAKSILGFFYLGMLPAFALGLVNLKSGNYWFLCLLVIVFFGDIGAYAAGVTLGKTKLAPLLSPKKSMQGAVGGILFSMMGGLMFLQWLPHVGVVKMVGISIVGGIAAQCGDLFESLIKRVANVKDSGKIMPGHGGVLDRLDGVLFASPVVYFAAFLIERGA